MNTEIKNIVSNKKDIKKLIFHKLVIEDYEVNFFQHYIFIIENQRYRFGVIEMMSIFGDDFLKKAKQARINLNKNVKKIKQFK